MVQTISHAPIVRNLALAAPPHKTLAPQDPCRPLESKSSSILAMTVLRLSGNYILWLVDFQNETLSFYMCRAFLFFFKNLVNERRM
jgi:hypothetical protein